MNESLGTSSVPFDATLICTWVFVPLFQSYSEYGHTIFCWVFTAHFDRIIQGKVENLNNYFKFFISSNLQLLKFENLV